MLSLSNRLSLVALGVAHDSPAVDIQPPLADGIHLRWGFSTANRPSNRGASVWNGSWIGSAAR